MPSIALVLFMMLVGALVPVREAAAGHHWRADRLPIGAGPRGAESSAASGVTMNVFVDTELNELRLDLDPAEGNTVVIRGPAAAGEAGEVRYTLVAESRGHGTWKYAEADEAAILAGHMVVEVESPDRRTRISGPIDGLVETSGTTGSTTGLTLMAVGFAALGVIVVATQRKTPASV